MANKKRTLGPRVTVLFKSGTGQGAGSKSQYIFMLKSVAAKLGIEPVKTLPTVTRKAPKTSKKKSESKMVVRGSSGAKRIKVPVPGTERAAKKGASVKYVSVPIPSGATLSDVIAFLGKASKKPKSFISPDGRMYSLETSTK